MAEIKAFRWLGPGRLDIAKGKGGKYVIIPPYVPGICERKCNVKDPENIAALGQARIAQLIKDGMAEPINWSDAVSAYLRSDAKPQNIETGEGSPELPDVETIAERAQEISNLHDFVQEESAKLATDATNREASAALHKMGHTSVTPVSSGPLVGAGPLK
jgi:hypothetical protein